MTWEAETATELSRYYPEFVQTEVPSGSGGCRAWRGVLRPFARSKEVIPIVADLEREEEINILSGGVLQHPPTCDRDHHLPYASALVNMDVEFDVVVVDRGQVQHPQVYCLRPTISLLTYPGHPHSRGDSEIAFIDRKLVHGLCVYLRSAQTKRHPGMFVWLIDQTAYYVAKHVVWVRTAAFKQIGYMTGLTVVFEDGRGLGAALTTARSNETGIGWVGHWPGPGVPHDPYSMLRMVAPHDECVCGSGQPFSGCCRPAHLRELRRRQAVLLTKLPHLPG